MIFQSTIDKLTCHLSLLSFYRVIKTTRLQINSWCKNYNASRVADDKSFKFNGDYSQENFGFKPISYGILPKKKNNI